MSVRQEILSQYGSLLLHAANEAETRLKVIDRILFEVLGWSHTDVRVEEHVTEDGKTVYADYIVSTAMNAFVIEAKRAGASDFDVPDTRRVRLDRRVMTSSAGPAIAQARDYARKLGIPFAVVTNGSKWIAFPASRVDQVKFEDSSAIVFPSLDSICATHLP